MRTEPLSHLEQASLDVKKARFSLQLVGDVMSEAEREQYEELLMLVAILQNGLTHIEKVLRTTIKFQDEK